MYLNTEIIDISVPIKNRMWSYRPEWKNTITEVESVIKGGKSTVYNFNLYSHTGTYIETCEHKLPINKKLAEFSLSSFVGKTLLVKVVPSSNNLITLESFLKEVNTLSIDITIIEKLIIFSGYGKNIDKDDYLINSPSFEENLTYYLIQLNLTLIGVDMPIIENKQKPYQPVNKLFEANNNLLLLAPLCVDENKVQTGFYNLNSLPINIDNVSASLCRTVLFKYE